MAKMNPKQKLVMKGLRDFVKRTTPEVAARQHAEIEAFKQRLHAPKK